MSGLARFNAQNHPQQTAKRGANDAIDDRATEPSFFALVDAEFHFTLDVAASESNAKCPAYYDKITNGLTSPWHGSVWCNPPYSDIGSWVDRAWSEWRRSRGPLRSIVMLLPANRTEQPWWHTNVEPFRDCGGSLSTRFIRNRLRFLNPGELVAKPNSRPPFGSVLLIWR